MVVHAGLASEEPDIDVMPGLQHMDDMLNADCETQLCIKNLSPLPISLCDGQIIAEGVPLPADMRLVRRGNNPITGEEPEILYTGPEGGDLCSMLIEQAIDCLLYTSPSPRDRG